MDTDTPLLQVSGLRVAFQSRRGQATVLNGVDFDLRAGETLCVVGESGCGKSMTALALLRLIPSPPGRITGGQVRFQGEDLVAAGEAHMRQVRGNRISMIFQEPMTSLNPVLTVGEQIAEPLRLHAGLDAAAARQRAVEMLRQVGIPAPERRVHEYPHQLSGGMRQRVLIAIAIALRPALIIADEPTSALDVTVQRRILDLIDALRRETGTAVLLVTHDLGVAADRSHRLVVMQGGRIQEQGPTLELLRNPQSAYTRRLLADAPSLAPAPRRTPRPATADDWAIEVEDLVHEFAAPGHASAHGRGIFRAVDGVSLRVRRGSTHAIVGESGSGKTTTIRAIVGLGRPTAGRIRIEGTEVTGLRGEALRQLRRRVQLVYQNPFSSLDPRQSVFDIIEEPLLNFDPLPASERRRRVHDMLERVGLPPAVLQRRPHALSGGQRQRVAIARALVLQPQVLVLDEAVSALDVTVQAQILALLAQLQQDLGLTYLFISHDLAVVRQIADTVSVLRAGRVVDAGSVEEVFQRPTSDYTRELMDAIPGKRSIDFVPHTA